jgi:hypothetical protein
MDLIAVPRPDECERERRTKVAHRDMEAASQMGDGVKAAQTLGYF